MAIKPEKNRNGLFGKPTARLANAGSLLGVEKEEQNPLVKPSLWIKREDYYKKDLTYYLRNKAVIDIGFVQMLICARY